MNERVVLVVDDDARLMRSITELFEYRGYKTLRAFTPADGYDLARHERPSAIVLDLRFQQNDEDEGMSLLRKLKADPAVCDIPTLIYAQTASEGSETWLRAMRAEADLVCSKGVSVYALVDMTTQLIVRHERRRAPRRTRLVPIDFDHETHQVYIDGLPFDAPLSAQDARLLYLLVQSCGKICTLDQIVDRIFRDPPASDDAIHQAVSRLRRALGDTEAPYKFIETVRGRGYRIVVRNPPQSLRCDGLA